MGYHRPTARLADGVQLLENGLNKLVTNRPRGRNFSSGNVQRVYPFEVRLEGEEAGLPQRSKVLLDQIRTVDKSRLGNRIGILTPERMEDVNRAIRLSLAV